MPDIFQSLFDNLQKNKEESKDITPFWSTGDIVRVPKSNTINILGVEHYLGEKCIVDKVEVVYGMINGPRVEYHLRLGNSLEPFWEDELDHRFKKKL